MKDFHEWLEDNKPLVGYDWEINELGFSHAQVIDLMRTAWLAATGWVKCADRLPNNDVTVLAFEKYSTVPFVGFVRNGSWYVNSEFLYVDGDAWLSDNLTQSLITHWQPLMAMPEDTPL